MDIIDGTITAIGENGEITIKATYDNLSRFVKCGFKNVRIALQDNRKITSEQRKKIHAMVEEIAEYVGEMPDVMKELLRMKFKQRYMQELAESFSFSDCSMALASEFIDMLVSFIIEWGVPLKQPLITFCEDVKKYVYACLRFKKCAVCGQAAELHHADVVGMGQNRKEIPHEGKAALPLCRQHHTQAHAMGDETFAETYHLATVRLDKDLCKIYKLKTER